MAKVKKDIKKLRYLEIKGKINPWLENQIKRIRSFSKPKATRATRAAKKYLSLMVVAAFLTATLVSSFLPKDEFQLLKQRLIRNPNDFETHLELAERFLENNQLEEAERALQIVDSFQASVVSEQVLGKTSSLETENWLLKTKRLWQQKHYSDPKDIRRLISAWEKIVEEKPNYRDGYLQLAYLHYKLYENDKAKEYLNKALDLDPNYEPARELERILNY
jgi:tetratricopeptide (TPR) repeat protein